MATQGIVSQYTYGKEKQPREAHVIKHILSTNMEQRPAEITISHLQPIIRPPKCRSKTITNPREPTTTRSIRLKHHKRLLHRLRISCTLQIRLNDLLSSRVGEECRKDGLWVNGCADTEGGLTIVCGVVLYCERRDGGLVRLNEAGVPNFLGCPLTCEIGTDEHGAVLNIAIFSKGVY